MSNDMSEGDRVSYLVSLLLDEKHENREHFYDAYALMKKYIHPVGFCLSQKGDLLSQWRGYAENGNGFSIGFSKKGLRKLAQSSSNSAFSVELIKVQYELKKQLKTITPLLEKINNIFADPKFSTKLSGLATIGSPQYQSMLISKKKDIQFEEILKELLPYDLILYQLKNISFKEEHEWRLLASIDERTSSLLEFNPKSNMLVPYVSINLENHLDELIKTITLGPKQLTDKYLIGKFIANCGFKNFQLFKSVISYR